MSDDAVALDGAAVTEAAGRLLTRGTATGDPKRVRRAVTTAPPASASRQSPRLRQRKQTTAATLSGAVRENPAVRHTASRERLFGRLIASPCPTATTSETTFTTRVPTAR
jgi:hypothetical protein